MNPVVHFEMPAEDRDRMCAFYEKAFGWKLQKYGPEMGNYVVATTADAGPDGRPTQPGTINGGFYPKSPDAPGPSVVIGVQDIRAAMEAVKAAGGQVLGGHLKNGEPDEIPGIGLYASFIDTEGNRVSLLQPKGMQ